jgi:hypothetical protein
MPSLGFATTIASASCIQWEDLFQQIGALIVCTGTRAVGVPDGRLAASGKKMPALIESSN